MVNHSSRHALFLPVVLTVQFLVALDMSVVNIALPGIRTGLGFAPEDLTWVVSAYALAFGGLLMLGGRLADVVGRRRVLIAGFTLFGAASLAGGLASEPWQLIAARAVQGVGAAALAPVGLTLITVMYPAGKERSGALAMWGAAGALGGAVGVLLGGMLTDWFGWRAVMLVNVPVVLLAVFAARIAVPLDDRHGARPRLDTAGAVLVTAGTTALVLGLVRAESLGWSSATTLLTLAAAALLLTAFAAVEARHRQPLLRLGMLRLRPVLSANMFSLLLAAGQFGAFYFVSLYLQQVLGYGPTATGAAFLPFCVGIVAGSVFAARTITRYGVRALTVTGGLLAAGGMAWWALVMTPESGFWLAVLPPSLLGSVGIGLCMVPLGTAATSGISAHEAGMASGLLNTSRQIGGSVGLALLVTVATAAGADGGGAGTPLMDGFPAAFWTAAALLAVGALSMAVLYREPDAGPGAPGAAEASGAVGGARVPGRPVDVGAGGAPGAGAGRVAPRGAALDGPDDSARPDPAAAP
ncbi:MFS transporter [Streptomyces uncialis]|uniref:MFS transporter n=1 Tax=Streptomyces uncialis TaxID=1048205 RepID=UPI002E2F1008|nr:MFS transporter [Streptomyces uncialis]